MQPGVKLAGVILNRVGGDAHAASTASAIRDATGLPTLGSLPHDPRLAVPERHLGLVPASEDGLSPATLERLTDLVIERFDLEAIRGIAESAAPLRQPFASEVPPVDIAPPVRVGVARDRAFGFYYADTFDVLGDLGAEVVPFSALDDTSLPANLDAVYLGGGFPELYAHQIAKNDGMRQSLETLVRRGAPLYAECGGLMALGQALVTLHGERLAGFGLLPLVSRMTQDRLTIGYREVEALRSTPLLDRGERMRGHEFHWSTADPPRTAVAAYRLVPEGVLEGYCVGSILASYVHLSFAASPAPLARFLQVAAQARESRTTRSS
jgi:cobyrinic acid a,c-diamide synthase